MNSIQIFLQLNVSLLVKLVSLSIKNKKKDVPIANADWSIYEQCVSETESYIQYYHVECCMRKSIFSTCIFVHLKLTYISLGQLCECRNIVFPLRVNVNLGNDRKVPG